MGERETKIMISNMDVRLLSEYFSKAYNCSKSDALKLIRKAICNVKFDDYKDYDVVYSLCEQPVVRTVAVK